MPSLPNQPSSASRVEQVRKLGSLSRPGVEPVSSVEFEGDEEDVAIQLEGMGRPDLLSGLADTSATEFHSPFPPGYRKG
ncbi:MAG: hypothetical protein IOD15_03975, partial [Phycisphaerales bacterium]|nr:hypothetical protein [Phycisphaerales bacterium]